MTGVALNHSCYLDDRIRNKTPCDIKAIRPKPHIQMLTGLNKHYIGFLCWTPRRTKSALAQLGRTSLLFSTCSKLIDPHIASWICLSQLLILPPIKESQPRSSDSNS